MQSVFGRTWFWILIVPVALVLVVFVWLVLPLRHAHPPAYPPQGAVVFVHTEVDRDSEGARLILSQARDRLLGAEPSSIEKFAFNVGVAVVMPKRISAWVVSGPSPSEPDYLAVIDLGRGGRIIRVLGTRAIRNRLFIEGAAGTVDGVRVHVDWQPEGNFAPAAFAFRKDTLLVSSSRDVLVNAVTEEQVLAERFDADVSRVLAEESGLLIVGNNSSGDVTRLIQAAEEEFAFALMPSVGSLQTMAMAASLRDGNALGTAVFTYDDPEWVNEAYSDLRYIYGVIRRLLRPRGLDMDSEITVNELTVQFDFSIEDALTILQSSPEGGN